MYLNKTTLIGNITKDIELKSLPNGIKVISFGLATNRTWKDKDGNKQESAEYHNIVAFGKQAEVIQQYCGKGDQLLIEGRIQTRSWDKEDGTKAYRTEIILESFQFGKKVENKAPIETPVERELNETVIDPSDGRELNLQDIPF